MLSDKQQQENVDNATISFVLQRCFFRFFLGMALCLQASGAGARLKEALTYLHEGLEHLLMTRQNEAEKEGENVVFAKEISVVTYRKCSSNVVF